MPLLKKLMKTKRNLQLPPIKKPGLAEHENSTDNQEMEAQYQERDTTTRASSIYWSLASAPHTSLPLRHSLTSHSHHSRHCYRHGRHAGSPS